MTTTENDRLDRIEALVEKNSRDIADLKNTLSDIERKLDIFIAKIDEKLNSIDQRLDSIDQRIERLENRVDKQDSRMWTLVGILVTTILGALAKVLFFPPNPPL